jgi:hypothetical protein
MGQRLFPGPGHHGRSICASRFSQPPDAFIRPMSASLIACWIHAWGSTLQSFPPPAQPYVVSNAVALLSLRRPSSAPSPTDLPLSRRPAGPVCGCPSAPRLQGFAPRQSLPLRAGGLDRPERMALMGFLVLQGSHPRRHNRAFTRFPLSSFLASTARRTTEIACLRSPPRLPRVSVSGEIGLAPPPLPPKQRRLWVLPTLVNFSRLLTTHASSEPRPIRESPPRASGCIAVP